jgi:hypothetical protein
MVDNTEIDQMQNEIKKGSLVMIKKGTSIRTTGLARNKVAGRDYMVKVFDVFQTPMVSVQEILNDDRYGYRELAIKHGADIAELEALRETNKSDYYRRLVTVGEAKITWVGTGGYWHETALANVEYMGEQA